MNDGQIKSDSDKYLNIFLVSNMLQSYIEQWRLSILSLCIKSNTITNHNESESMSIRNLMFPFSLW